MWGQSRMALKMGGMLPLQGRDAISPRPRAALALALGYGMKPPWGLEVGCGASPAY